MIDFALSLFEGPVLGASEQIKMYMLFPLKGMYGAKVVNISETPKKWEDFLIRRALPYPAADIKNGYIYSLVLGVYVTTLWRLSLTILYHISYFPCTFFQPL